MVQLKVRPGQEFNNGCLEQLKVALLTSNIALFPEIHYRFSVKFLVEVQMSYLKVNFRVKKSFPII